MQCEDAGAYDERLFQAVEDLGYVIRANRWISGFYPVCIMMRLFKAFAAQPRLAIVTKTLALAATDLTHFGIAACREDRNPSRFRIYLDDRP